jgi:DUF4097 and DUF4098 domain-containing protein YvlB
MTRVFLSLAAALAVLPALPSPARAQVYPERVVVSERARVLAAAYQRRSRDENAREEQVERTTKTLRLGQNGSLSLANIAGDITVTRAGGQDTTVEIVKTARGRDAADARELLQLVAVEVTERGGRAEVKARYPSGEQARRNNRRNVNVSVAYTVSAPQGTRISIESISGSVRVTDIKGDVNANTISGDVRVTGAGRIGMAKSVSGTVEITDAQMDGALETSSVSGDVVVRRVRARSIEAGSVSGSVRLEDVECDRVEASTTSASILFSGPLAPNGRYELNGFSGDVRVVVAGTTGFELDASTFSGDIRTDFPITTRGARGRRTLTGTYGDGSAVLDLTTFSGSIIVSRK